MSTWLAVWLIVAIVSTVAVIACLVALVRHVLILGRSARELQQAVTPFADAITAGGRRASERASSLELPGSRPPAGGE